MISIRKTRLSELKQISDMGCQNHVGDFLNHTPHEKHKYNFKSSDVIYLSILSASEKLAGYVIIRKEKQLGTVQLKRIVMDEKYLGLGSEAIKSAEHYCVSVLKCTRLWLDVYEDNLRAVHVYEKLGYKIFKEGIENAKSVLFYEKTFRIKWALKN